MLSIKILVGSKRKASQVLPERVEFTDLKMNAPSGGHYSLVVSVAPCGSPVDSVSIIDYAHTVYLTIAFKNGCR